MNPERNPKHLWTRLPVPAAAQTGLTPAGLEQWAQQHTAALAAVSTQRTRFEAELSHIHQWLRWLVYALIGWGLASMVWVKS
jgi:hypothetical protein